MTLTFKEDDKKKERKRNYMREYMRSYLRQNPARREKMRNNNLRRYYRNKGYNEEQIEAYLTNRRRISQY